MRRLTTLLALVVLAAGVLSLVHYQPASAQVPRNVVLEFCTGTWCQWCPCGHATAEALLVSYPNLIVHAYHGSGTDPWRYFNGYAVRSMLGFAAYPTGVVDRRNHPGNGSGYPYVDYTQWTRLVSQRYANSPTTNVNLQLLTRSYNPLSRQFDISVRATALASLTGLYKISFVLTEDELVYPQAGNGTCGYPPPTYKHRWTARNMVNGPAGDTLVSGTWNQNQAIIRSFSTIIDTACTPTNCKFTVMVYRDSANSLYFSEIAQAIQNTVLGGNPTEVGTQNPVGPTAYVLDQNYPNPFNPVTHINYSVAQTGKVTLKLFDVMGREVATLVNETKARGTHTVPFDASGFSSGVYFYQLKAGTYTSTKKLILAK